jgi:hypothetical protein
LGILNLSEMLIPQRIRHPSSSTQNSKLNTQNSKAMNLFRSRAHHLIDRLSDEDLECLWTELETLYYDCYLLQAVQAAKKTHRPGDTLTREEALRLLPLIQSSPRTL